MRQYIGLIHKEDASDYGVSFPDFPGVVTGRQDNCRSASARRGGARLSHRGAHRRRRIDSGADAARTGSENRRTRHFLGASEACDTVSRSAEKKVACLSASLSPSRRTARNARSRRDICVDAFLPGSNGRSSCAISDIRTSCRCRRTLGTRLRKTPVPCYPPTGVATPQTQSAGPR